MKSELPNFFEYSISKKDTGFETFQDFWLSRTLRCSVEKYIVKDKAVYDRARLIAYMLLKGTNDVGGKYEYQNQIPDDFIIESVSAIRQNKRIDLIVILKVTEWGQQKEYALNIENKWYTSTSANQLKNAVHNFKKYLGKENNSIQRNLLIYCDESNYSRDKSQAICRENDFQWLSIQGLKEILVANFPAPSGNELFDTYWYYSVSST